MVQSKKIKITNHQLFSLAVGGSIGGSVIIISALITSIAKQDAWITALLTPIFGIVVIWVYWSLGNQYPNLTLFGITNRILGKWIGFIITVGFIIFCFTSSSRVVWHAGNFITTQAMPNTPTEVIDLLYVIAIVISVLYGIETIARASEIFIDFVSILFFIAIFLVSPNAKLENLQPVFERGLMPILKGSVFLSSFVTFPLITLMMIYPLNIEYISQAKMPLLKGYLWSTFMTFISIFMSILVLGSAVTSMSQYPTYLLMKEINIGIIFTRLEFLIIAVWIVTEFIIGILFFYAGTIALSELLVLKDNKSIVIPLGLIVLVLSWIAFPNIIYEAQWDSCVWTPYVITHGLIIPVLLLLVAYIKNKFINI